MELHTITTYLFGENIYIIYNAETREAAIVDPGMMNSNETAEVNRFIETNNLNVKYLINTHMHVDHVCGNDWVRSTYGVKTTGSLDDQMLADRVAIQAQMFHLPGNFPEKVCIDNPVKDGDVLTLGIERIEVIAVPGHSLGSICLYVPDSGFVITGDALFQGSIGRTDLPGGDYKTLVDSIKAKLLKLPEDTVVYPGHGPATTIGAERALNPYLR